MFKIRLVPSKHVVTRDEMTTPDPNRKSTDFSSKEHKEKAHRSAGYTKVGRSDRSTDDTLVIHQEDGHLYRSQDGDLWEKIP